MSINKKSDSTNPVSREGLGFTLTSANQGAYPVVYSDDVWTIVKASTELSKVVGLLSGCGVIGTYGLDEILEVISSVVSENRDLIDNALGGGGSVQEIVNAAIARLDSTKTASSNGVSVTITETDGIITGLSVSAPDFSNTFDVKGAAAAVLGKPTDTKASPTVYGAFKAAEDAYSRAVAQIDALNAVATGVNNGVQVTVRQENGLISSVEVSCALIGFPSDSPEADTIWGAKNLAKSVLGTLSDTKYDKTVYGAFAYINEISGDYQKIKRIPNKKIEDLFCE